MNISLLFSTEKWYIVADLCRYKNGNLYWAVDMFDIKAVRLTIEEMKKATGTIYRESLPPLLDIPDRQEYFFVPYETIPL